MKFFSVVAALFSLTGFSAGAHAYTAEALKAYCQDGNHNYKITKGLQPNKLAANKTVLDLAPGKYNLPDGSKLEVNDAVEVKVDDSRMANATVSKQNNSTYTLLIQPKANPVFGTHAADKMDGAPHEMGGCSLEQLSELLDKNHIPAKFEEDKAAEEKK